MMSTRGKDAYRALVDIKFEENLTWISCSKIVIEIIKYLAYQKQQIPYPFDQLKLLIKKKKIDETGAGNAINKPGKYHNKATVAVETLESIFQNIEAEFMIGSQSGFGGVEEVVVLFGATPVTPKDVFRIQIPEIRSDLETPKPPSRKMMIQLLRCLLESDSLHSVISQPVTTTNTFIFFKRRLNYFRAPENFANKSWFLPRENFKLPQKGRQAVLRIEYAPKENIAVEAESPLARPLVGISDSEGTPLKDDRYPLKKMGNIMQQGHSVNERVIKIPGVKLPNHLVFKSRQPLPGDMASNLPVSGYDMVPDGEVQCLAGDVAGSMNRLSDDFEKLTFSPCVENGESNFNHIEWYEARAPIRGFKDCVVNGVSAITS
ncbi:MAD2L1-binding protein [Hetaerina americana]|uniref:MAD2L1-binding protein n=1 Tax=Hetaerina americana TaxID=62018 RepID=UPI003A7F5DCB